MFDKYKKELEGVKAWLLEEYKSIRTSMATPAILDGVKVLAYGASMPVNQVATISIEGAKSLLISPFDGGLTKDIESAISKAELGLSTSVSGNGIFLTFPDLTSDKRTLLAKVAKDKLEDAKVSMRKKRDEVWKEIQKLEKDGEISEDQKFSDKEKMEEITRDFSSELDDVYKNKEKEIII